MEDRIMKLYKELDFFYLIIHLLKMIVLMNKMRCIQIWQI